MMSVETYIRAMPKVDLHVQLEGAISRERLLQIAEQTDIAETYKRLKDYHAWVDLLEQPDYARLQELARETASWVRHPQDLARIVYDFGVSCSKQNVTYAEVSFVPTVYTDTGITFQTLLEALNDGRDRAERAWQVLMRWIVSIDHEQPRRSDDIARWATSVTAQKGHVRALGLLGRAETQPIAQFRKAFTTAQKKELARVTHAFTHDDPEALEHVIDVADPMRLTNVWALLADEATLDVLASTQLPILVTPSREILLERIEHISEYPFRRLLDRGINLIIGSGMPALYETTLTDELLSAVKHGSLRIADVEDMMLRAVRASFLPLEQRNALRDEFASTYDALRDEHLSEEPTGE